MSRPRRSERAVVVSERVYRSLLRAYPPEIRDEYGEEMARCFRDLCREAVERGGIGLAALWVHSLSDLIGAALKERSAMFAGNTYRFVGGVALAVAFLVAWADLAFTAIEEPNGLSWMAPIGFFAIPVVGIFAAYRGTKTRGIAYRVAVCAALAAAFLLAFVNLAIGVIGSEDNPANFMYIGVLAVEVIGAVAARLRAEGMARVLFTTALAQALVALIALILGLGEPWSGPLEILGVNGFFVALFVGSALLFRFAANQQTPAGEESEA